MNEINQDNFRVEIATLDEEVKIDKESIKKTVTGKFKIPVLMTTDTVANVQTSNKNVLNRTNSSLKGSSMNLNNTIELTIPKEYLICYKGTKIPKDTKFMVSFVSGNVNDIKVIGRYGGDPELSNTEKKAINDKKKAVENGDEKEESVAKSSGTASDRSILEYILDCIENFEKRISTIEEALEIQSEKVESLFETTDELKDTANQLKDTANSLEQSNTEMGNRISALEQSQTTPSGDAEGTVPTGDEDDETGGDP